MQTMDATELEDVTKLRAWPEIGKAYLVPSINVEHCGLTADWPVYGPAHIDHTRSPSPTLGASFLRQFIHAPHLHVDPRFLTPEMDEALAAQWSKTRNSLAPGKAVVLHSGHPDHLKAALSFGLGDFEYLAQRPVPKPMVCVRSVVAWDVGARDVEWPQDHKYPIDFSAVQPAVVSEDALPLCPHHALNLHCVWDGKSATVRCPMHGLEVDMTAFARR